MVSETLDEHGEVVSRDTTETTTTLIELTETCYTLQVSVGVEAAGRQFEAQPKLVTRGYYGETEGQPVKLKKVAEEELVLDNYKIPTQVFEVVIDRGGSRRVSTLHYSDRVAPFILQRETLSTDRDGKTVHYQTRAEVLALAMPHKVLGETKTAAHLKTVHKKPSGTTITLEVHCPDVPGGVVAHTSKELDARGQLVRRSTLELVNYGLGEQADSGRSVGRRGILHRYRSRRAASPGP